MKSDRTDWDSYYRKTAAYTSITRYISRKKIINAICNAVSKNMVTVCELGGANSCVMDAVIRFLPVSHYHVIDNNKFGLSLLNNRLSSVPITLEEADILDGSRGQQKKFDVVYSVGLIEHFDPIGTRRAIRAHFERCEVGGVVLITFPTPTVLYKLLRAIAEMIGKWPFHDERPLNFDEVELTCDQHGVILHRSINWLIGFTQGYVVYRKLY